jgi:hypothetical protein
MLLAYQAFVTAFTFTLSDWSASFLVTCSRLVRVVAADMTLHLLSGVMLMFLLLG